MKRYIYFIVVSLWIAISVSAQNQEAVRVACVGNSITYGAGLQKRFQNSYPGVLQQMLGKGYDVRNYGISARTLLNKGDYPYMKENAYKEALAFLPNIVTIKLGTNDSKPHNWIYGKEFKNDLQELVLSFKNLPSKPKIYLCLPVPPTKVQWGINDSTIVESIIPIIKSVAKNTKLRL
jgi:Lysophospholipase L1 and related esterases